MTKMILSSVLLVGVGFLGLCGCNKATNGPSPDGSCTPPDGGSFDLRTALDTAIGTFPSGAQAMLRDIVLRDGFAGVITKEQAQALATQLAASPENTALALVNLASVYAKTPISNYNVGAVAIGSSGAMYFGCNLEFAGLPLSASVHGEQSATTNAWMNGESGLATLAITAAPCGYCRQFLNELSTATSLGILLSADAGPTPLLTLLPMPFGPSDLGMTGALMKPGQQALSLPKAGTDALVAAALAAASTSYAPYSTNYAGAALQSSSGVVVSGRIAENAAYNPSMSPMQAALSEYNLTGQNFANIARAVLVQANPCTTNQEDASRAVLGSIAPQVSLEVYLATSN